MVRVQDVEKTYAVRGGAAVEALQPTSFDIGKGEFLSIIGPSGCGKSSLLKLLAGLLAPSAGQIEVAGRGVHRPITDVGIVFQDDLLMPWRSAIDNVLIQAEVRRLPVDEMRERARELLKMVGLAGFEDRYPHELSGGMRQRVSICRALVHDPDLLLLDEPFGALDALTRDQMALDIQRLFTEGDKTIVFITHSIPEAILLGDRVLIFSSRPGSVEADIPVSLPRPRGNTVRSSSAYSELVNDVRSRFERLGVISGTPQASMGPEGSGSR